MQQTTRDVGMLEALTVSAEDEKAKKLIFNLFSSTYKIPLLSLLLFGTFAVRALYPENFSFAFKRHNTYQFSSESLGFFIGDINFFANSSHEEAEGKIVELFPPGLQKKVKRVIRPVLVLSEKYQVDPFWVLSLMWTESHFRHESISRRGARGLMQVMPPTYMETLATMKASGIALESDRGEDYLRYHYGQTFYELGHAKLVSKLRNMEVGIYYLKGLLDSFNGNHHYATVAYNMGPYWTKSRLKNNLPVGVKNHYLNKVLKNYYHITKSLSQSSNVTFIPRI